MGADGFPLFFYLQKSKNSKTFLQCYLPDLEHLQCQVLQQDYSNSRYCALKWSQPRNLCYDLGLAVLFVVGIQWDSPLVCCPELQGGEEYKWNKYRHSEVSSMFGFKLHSLCDTPLPFPQE